MSSEFLQCTVTLFSTLVTAPSRIFFFFSFFHIIFISFIIIFFDLGVQIFPLHNHYFHFHIVFTFTFTVDNHTNPHYNEMSIISRSRQFMVFRAKRVKFNVGFKRKLSWFFIIRLKEGASGNDFTGQLQKAQTHLKDGPNHFSKLCESFPNFKRFQGRS